MAKEVIAWCNAGWYGEGDLPFIRDHAIYAPCLVGSDKTVLPNLEPLQPCDGGLESTRNLRT